MDRRGIPCVRREIPYVDRRGMIFSEGEKEKKASLRRSIMK